MELNDLIAQTRETSRQGQQLEEQRRGLENLAQQIKTSLGVEQTRVANQPAILEVLEGLQWAEHQKVLGTFEKLLSALLEDVFGEPRRVVMTMGINAGVTTLDLWLLKKDEIPADFEQLSLEERAKLNLEDAEQGTGGAVSNVLITGLRLITLHKSGGRQFMVLDEADCWIKPGLVGRFGEVVRQVSQELGIQILMISHHEGSCFPQITHKLRLVKSSAGEGKAETLKIEPVVETNSREGKAKDEGADDWREGQIGIRSIDLFNFQAHDHTHLPLGPGVTLLSGDHDLGKSAIVRSLRAVFYGESNDRLIQHEANEAKVVVEAEGGKVLVWERWKKPPKHKKKENYTLYQKGETVPRFNTANSRGVPAWLDQELGIHLMGGLDVQLGKQKDPIFLLNQPGSVRAKALAIGHDSQYISAMMEQAKLEYGRSKLKVKMGEEQLEELARKIARRELKIDWAEGERQQEAVKERAGRIAKDRQLLATWGKWRACRARREAVEGYQAVARVTGQAGLARAKQVMTKWQQAVGVAQSRRGVEAYQDVKPVQNQPRLGEARKLVSRWRKNQGMLGVAAALEAGDPGWLRKQQAEQMTKSQRLGVNNALVQKWQGSQEQERQARAAMDKARGQIQEQAEALERLRPAICPLCQQPWGRDHGHLGHKQGMGEDHQEQGQQEHQHLGDESRKKEGQESRKQEARRGGGQEQASKPQRGRKGVVDF